MSEAFLARLPMDEDLLEAIKKEFQERSVPKATFTLIGLLTRSVLGYYDVDTREYVNKEFESPMEIVSCTGNISEKDGETFVHAHVVLAGDDYGCIGGHLMPGSTIFAAELSAHPVPGAVPVRKFDDPTGLFLWAND